MIIAKDILFDNAELVKKIEDSTSSMRSFILKKERNGIIKNSIIWHKYKKN